MRVRILQDFTGYPDGTDASRRLFRTGETPDLPDGFAALITGKGLAEDAPLDVVEER